LQLANDWQCILTTSAARLTVTLIKSAISRKGLALSKHGLCSTYGGSFIEGYPPDMTSPYGRWDRGWLAVVEEYSKHKFAKVSDNYQLH
jgi:hypothetical protein